MPRPMPRLDIALGQEVTKAIALTRAGESVRVLAGSGSALDREWPRPRLEALYELAFLRSFVAWEVFLEETFFRYLCGYSSPMHGQAVLVPGGTYYATLHAAESGVLGNAQYMLWHNPQRVVTRCAARIVNGRHEQVINSSFARIEHFANVRHRVAHDSQDARAKFNAATQALAVKPYRGARAGAFLRDWVPGVMPRVRWLERITSELVGLAGQIV